MDSAMSKWTSYNGVVNTMGYDSDLRLTGISVPGVQSLAFTWDAADRITAITNGINGNYTQSLGYDAVDRLTSMTSGARSELPVHKRCQGQFTAGCRRRDFS